MYRYLRAATREKDEQMSEQREVLQGWHRERQRAHGEKTPRTQKRSWDRQTKFLHC